MLIDFQTIFIQIINFLVLVALLKRFLYHPILKAMRQRERHINGQIQEAADQKAIAQAEAEHYLQMQASFEQKRERLKAQAQSEVETYRQELLTAAQVESEQMQLKWAETLRREQQHFLKTLRQNMGGELVKTLRFVLKDLAQTHLEDSVVEVFLQRLSELSDSEAATLAQAFSHLGNAPLKLHSAFPLSLEQQTQIRQALLRYQSDAEILAEKIVVEQQPQLLCGIELNLPGYKLAWTLDHYLQTFESRVRQLLEQQDDIGIPDLSTVDLP